MSYFDVLAHTLLTFLDPSSLASRFVSLSRLLHSSILPKPRQFFQSSLCRQQRKRPHCDCYWIRLPPPSHLHPDKLLLVTRGYFVFERKRRATETNALSVHIPPSLSISLSRSPLTTHIQRTAHTTTTSAIQTHSHSTTKHTQHITTQPCPQTRYTQTASSNCNLHRLNQRHTPIKRT